MNIPKRVYDDFKLVDPRSVIGIMSKVLIFEGETTQTEYIFYYTQDLWHIQPMMELCYLDWEEKMVFLNRTVFTKADILSLPDDLVDALDLAAVEFHYQGGWDRILYELFGVKTFPKTREEMLDASRVLNAEMGVFLNELEAIYESYLQIKSDVPVEWIKGHARKLINGHIKTLQNEKKRLTGKRVREGLNGL